jgi:hypothetical protein
MFPFQALNHLHQPWVVARRPQGATRPPPEYRAPKKRMLPAAPPIQMQQLRMANEQSSMDRRMRKEEKKDCIVDGDSFEGRQRQAQDMMRRRQLEQVYCGAILVGGLGAPC